jgi:hypothetical protein
MESSVTIYALTKIEVPHVMGTNTEDIVGNAVAATDLRGFAGLARYEVESPQGTIYFHDKAHLEVLHEQRLDLALPFDLNEHIEETTATYLHRKNLKVEKVEEESAAWEWSLQTGEFRCSYLQSCSSRTCPLNDLIPNQKGEPLWMKGTCTDLVKKLCGLVIFFCLLPLWKAQPMEISRFTSLRPAPITSEVPANRTRLARRHAFA